MLAAIDSWLFLLLIAMAGLLRLLASKAGSSKARSDAEPSQPASTSPRPSSPRPASDSDEEQIRKFLEALGQGPGSKPPPPVVRRTDVPPRPLAPVRPPRGGVFPFPGADPRAMPAQERKTEARSAEETTSASGEWLREERVEPVIAEKTARTRKVIIPRTPAARTEPLISEPAVPTPLPNALEPYALASSAVPVGKIDLAALLRSPNGLQTAVVLREIFGPPRSLQALSDPAGF